MRTLAGFLSHNSYSSLSAGINGNTALENGRIAVSEGTLYKCGFMLVAALDIHKQIGNSCGAARGRVPRTAICMLIVQTQQPNTRGRTSGNCYKN